MKSNLFIFAIGGTGSRVIKALTMLLASGVEMQNTDTVVPIIVDPHTGNLDLSRTETLLRNYQRVRKSLKSEPKAGDFFATKITTLKEMVGNDEKLKDSYTFELKGVSKEKFRDYIDFPTLDESNKALASLLFSEENLNTEMDIGFVGNPNIGSVVLNQFEESDEFRLFASKFRENDRIFIISSIFGGTGASGFPIILKNIRGASAKNGIPNHAFLQKAKIGAVSVLPYFGVKPQSGEENRIDKATFVSKTKAALHYYTRGVNHTVNKMYYIGDPVNKDYDNDPGEGGQKNDAHLVEMITAMAIVDFMKTSDNNLSVSNNLPEIPLYSEFGIKNESTSLTLNDFSHGSVEMIGKPLSKMSFFVRYLNEHIQSSSGKTAWSKDEPKIDSSFLSGSFYSSFLREFIKSYEEWLKEMARNERHFKAFLIDSSVPLAETIVGVKPKSGFLKGNLDFDSYDEYISTEAKANRSFPSAEDKLMTLFANATDKLVHDRYESLFGK